MKSLDELRVFYERDLLPDLRRLEKVRLEQVQKMLRWIVPSVLAGLGLALMLRDLGPAPGIIIFFSLLMAIILFNQITRGYKAEFKDVIIAPLVAFVDPSLQYDKDGMIPLDRFRLSRLFLKTPEIYNGDDLVKGKIGATAVEFSEVHAAYETRDSKGRRQRHTIHRGLFFIADFNKHFAGETFVLPDRSERLFKGISRFFQSLGRRRPDLVKLEDPDFERHFVVYSTDQTEARYILSPSLMLRIVEFKEKAGRNIRLSFLDSNVHIAISFSRNLFEPRMFQSLLNVEPIEEYFEDLQLAVGIVEDLNLNTRIWTKD